MPQSAKFASINTWATISGLSRATTYRLIQRGKLRAVKSGRRTLIDVDAGLAYLHALPAMQVRT